MLSKENKYNPVRPTKMSASHNLIHEFEQTLISFPIP